MRLAACFVTLLVSSALALATLSASPVKAEASPPDIVVIMVDDLGAIDERVLERLPNIKSLWLDHGLRFDAAYSETPLCCPGRAAFLTGQHTRHHGVTRNNALQLDPSATLATELDAAGYWTVQTGKYLNRSALLADNTPPGWDRAVMAHTGGYSTSWSVHGVPVTRGNHDRVLIEYTLAEARQALGMGPLFMWVNPRAPHNTIPSKPWKPLIERRYAQDSRCTGVAPWKPPTYSLPARPNGFPLVGICRSLLTTDELVGRLRTELSAQGRDPVWLFTSDNGMAWGAGGYALKNVSQAGRLPLYIAGPGVTQGSTNALVSNIDLGPTLAALARTSLDDADGVSFAALLSGGQRGREWMLEDHPEPPAGMTPYWGIRTPEWHLLNRAGQATVLFDIVNDPWEQHPVDNVAVAEELSALYPY